jgi:hypothetical protein
MVPKRQENKNTDIGWKEQEARMAGRRSIPISFGFLGVFGCSSLLTDTTMTNLPIRHPFERNRKEKEKEKNTDIGCRVKKERWSTLFWIPKAVAGGGKVVEEKDEKQRFSDKNKTTTKPKTTKTTPIESPCRGEANGVRIWRI